MAKSDPSSISKSPGVKNERSLAPNINFTIAFTYSLVVSSPSFLALS